MGIKGMIQGSTEIKTAAEDFFDAAGGRPHHVAGMSPENVHNCVLHDGEYGSIGSIIEWHYTHDGEKKSTKVVREIFDGKYEMVCKIIEGNFSEEYSEFYITCKVVPKPADDHQSGSFVHWILEYEKPDEKTPDPTSFLGFFLAISKDMDAHIQEAASASA